MSRVLRKPAAVRDLIANGRHIAKDNFSASERFLDPAERTFAELTRHFHMAKCVNWTPARKPPWPVDRLKSANPPRHPQNFLPLS